MWWHFCFQQWHHEKNQRVLNPPLRFGLSLTGIYLEDHPTHRKWLALVSPLGLFHLQVAYNSTYHAKMGWSSGFPKFPMGHGRSTAPQNPSKIHGREEFWTFLFGFPEATPRELMVSRFSAGIFAPKPQAVRPHFPYVPSGCSRRCLHCHVWRGDGGGEAGLTGDLKAVTRGEFLIISPLLMLTHLIEDYIMITLW